MLKWFSISGIVKEAKRIKWPKFSELSFNTVESLFFMGFFMLFFVGCEFVITYLLKFIGIGV